MKKDGTSLWRATAEHAPSLSSLGGEVTTDIAIIGCGIMGASAALSLVKNGVGVVVLEAGRVGDGASSRPGGFVVPTFTFGTPGQVINHLGETGERLVQMTGSGADRVYQIIRDNHISCDAKQAGWYQPAHTEQAWANMQRGAEEWRRAGFDVEVLSGEETYRRSGVPGYFGSWTTPTGGTIHPLSYVFGMINAVVAAGGRVYEQSPALRIEKKSGKIHIHSRNGTVICDRVLLCTNAQSRGLAPDLEKSIVPMTIWQMATTPIPAEHRQHLFKNGESLSDTRANLFTYRFDRDWRLITGLIDSVGMEASRAANIMANSLKRRLALPFVPKAEFIWTGRASVTRSRLPEISVIDDGVIAAVACNGRGIVLSTVIGEALARFACDQSARDLPLPITRPTGGLDVMAQKLLSPLYYYYAAFQDWRSEAK